MHGSFKTQLLKENIQNKHMFGKTLKNNTAYSKNVHIILYLFMIVR